MKQVTEEQLIGWFNDYLNQLYDDKKVSATKFSAMQTAIYGCKCLVRDAFGSPRKKENALTK